MLHLLDSILAHLPRLFSTTSSVSVPLPAPAPEDQSWYVNVWGVISRDRAQVYKDCVSACETPAQHPIYWVPTFDNVVQYLPRCRGFETAFGFGSEDPELFFVVDWDPHVYYDSYAAENAWTHQGERKSAVLVTLSWNDAWARAQHWTTNYSGYLHAT
ncbi:hypothetical protein B0H14DRAFT_2617875 [Mycena olivaceomarginata]|nr:hypothetical protein B0H14DRAFT_2617875 [Mycena olivaceomarginata]